MKRLILSALGIAILAVGISIALPVQTRPQPASAADTSTISECPAPTEKGAYFERGVGKDGNVICGFAYYNACPYTEGAENGTPECEKAKPTEEQLQPWQPTQPNPAQPSEVAQCGGK